MEPWPMQVQNVQAVAASSGPAGPPGPQGPGGPAAPAGPGAGAVTTAGNNGGMSPVECAGPLLCPSYIKKEADTVASYVGSVPSTEMEFCDGIESQRYDVSQSESPGSPDQHYCSSTTQSIGESVLGHTEGLKEEDIPRRLCLVCGDVASGFHYGVASCEACKAFFKRTIQGNIEYSCPAAGDCEINKRRRKACQACRFQKCLGMGMLKEGVRLDRVRGGRQKYRRSGDSTYQPYTHIMSKPVPSLHGALLPWSVAPLDQGMGHKRRRSSINLDVDQLKRIQVRHVSKLLKGWDNKMLEALIACEPEFLTAPEHGLTGELRTLALLSDLYDKELVNIITWAKLIPGFLELPLNDQMRLLQSTWAEILTLTLSFRSLPGSGRLRFAQDFSLDEKTARECGALELYLEVVTRLQRLPISREEYLLLKALVLANSDVCLDQASVLLNFRDSILSALADCVQALRAGAAAGHFQELLLCLPSLRQSDGSVRRFWRGVHRDNRVPMNKLFVEMLEAGAR